MIRHALALLACALACALEPSATSLERSITVEDVADLPPCSRLTLPEGDVAVAAVEDAGGLAAVAVDGLLICVDDVENLTGGAFDLPSLDTDVDVSNPAGDVSDGTPLPANDHADGTPLPAQSQGTPLDEVSTIDTIETAATGAALTR